MPTSLHDGQSRLSPLSPTAEGEVVADMEAGVGSRRSSVTSAGGGSVAGGSVLGHQSTLGHLPSCGEPDRSLLSKIIAFHDQRKQDKSRMFRNVMVLAAALVVVGVLGSVCVGVLQAMWSGSYVPPAFLVITLSMNCWAVVAFASCLTDELDINDFARIRPRTVTAGWAAIALNAIFRFATGGLVNILEVPVAACGTLYSWERACPTWWPPFSTWTALWFAAYFLAAGARRIPPLQSPSSTETALPVAIAGIGCLYVLTAAVTLAAWVWSRGPSLRRSPTMLFYFNSVLWATLLGLQDLLHGVAWLLLPAGSPDHIGAAIAVLRGVSILIPPFVIVTVGRVRLFNFLARLFDADPARLRRDGAFVAELLETTTPIRVGQAWWVHKEEADERFPWFDPRRNWQRGVVVEPPKEGSSEFAVQLRVPQEVGRAAPRVRVRLPSAAAARTREEILHEAQACLRCVEFEKLSEELMRKEESRGDPQRQAEWYSLSRPVRPGERIDYFMSHSWNDDAAVKWATIKKVAERFRGQTGHYPTFWLDKVCIDQTALADGLKDLPVNVMASSKVLVLCGATYPSRLWCVWELFTLYAFTSEACARERVECVFLGDSRQGEKILNRLRKFRVRNAHCYDPNEESRLRRVITAVGTEVFDQRICQMAQQLKVEQQDMRNGGKLSSLISGVSGVVSG